MMAHGVSNVWTRHPQNPVLGLRPGHFDSNHIHAPVVIRENDRYRMWYSGSDREQNAYHRIGYAESQDGVSWIRLNRPVIEPDSAEGYYTTPSVLNTSECPAGVPYSMWFSGRPDTSDLHLAVSQDGIEWEVRDPDPLQLKAYSPTVLFEEGCYRMWYTRVEVDGKMTIGHATSPDGVDWQPLHSPVMIPTEPWEKRNILYPYVLMRSGTYEMFYTSYGPRCELALATSRDGIRWTKGDGPILRPDPASDWDSLYCSSACVVPEDGGRDKLYYASRIDMVHKYFAIGLAERTERNRNGLLR